MVSAAGGTERQALRYFIERERLTMEGSDASMGCTASASNGMALTAMPNEIETPLVGAAGGLGRAFRRWSASQGT
jgi:hypothetical protein